MKKGRLAARTEALLYSASENGPVRRNRGAYPAVAGWAACLPGWAARESKCAGRRWQGGGAASRRRAAGRAADKKSAPVRGRKTVLIFSVQAALMSVPAVLAGGEGQASLSGGAGIGPVPFRDCKNAVAGVNKR